MNAIVACDRNWGIGKNNDLLVKIPGDMKYFREKTRNSIIIIGRKTLESFPGAKPLPYRTNIVLTRNRQYENDECIVCHDVDELNGKIDELLKEEPGRDIYVCGGGEIYRMLIHMCDEVLVTKVDVEMEAETFFPDMDADPAFEMTWEGDEREELGMKYRFTKYEKKPE